MTLAELTARLAASAIPDPETDARLLLTHCFDISDAALRADPQRDFASDALTRALDRRLKREPLQHILGEVDFYGETYQVSADCLIPRADTELLVDEAIRLLPKNARFADLCTGSGCIAISVCAHRFDLTALAVDVSEAALSLAQTNAARNGVAEKISFFKDSVLAPALQERRFDAILSNPPYIPTAHLVQLAPELSFEPRIALDGGADGMLFYRAILQNFSAPLYLFEIGYDQREDILALAQERGLRARVLRDFGGNDRLAILEEA